MELNFTANYHPLPLAKSARENNEFNGGPSKTPRHDSNQDQSDQISSEQSENPSVVISNTALSHQRISWTQRVIEAQASRVLDSPDDAIELKPITIESQPSHNIRQFLQVARNGLSQKLSIDIYVWRFFAIFSQ